MREEGRTELESTKYGVRSTEYEGWSSEARKYEVRSTKDEGIRNGKGDGRAKLENIKH